MAFWLLVEWFHRLFGGAPIPRDARHRYVTPRGVAYEVSVAPVPGMMGAAEVTLAGEPVIRSTALPGLTMIVRPTALRVGTAVRYLLREADRQTRLCEQLAAEFPVHLAAEPTLSEEATALLVEQLSERVHARLTAPSAEELAES